METKVNKIPMNSPEDLTGLLALVSNGSIKPHEVIAIMGKTEGNGCVNDFTRGYTTLALKNYFSDTLNIRPDDVGNRIAIIMSGGTEGVISPHITVFSKTEPSNQKPTGMHLAIDSTHTRDFLPEEIGRLPQIFETAKAIQDSMHRMGINNPRDVHFVQIKCPLLTASRIADATSRSHDVATHDTYKSMGYSRAASALGVGLALGEINEDQLSDETVCRDWNLFSEVASTSAGIELLNNEIIVMGNASSWAGELVISHSIMKDAIDSEAVIEALKVAGIKFTDGRIDQDQQAKIINVFAKAEADPGGSIRGRRHTMLDDSDINQTRHARAVVGGVIASIVGDPMIYVSGGAEHQGPPGGGPVAVIAQS
ncbi:MAG: ring-opening amidohydrolase [Anaerolineaceae bacterium]